MPASTMRPRRLARERALELCYELEQRPGSLDALLAGLPSAPEDYSVALARGVEEHRGEIDELLRRYSQHWALERMPVVDRAILRLGCYELAYLPGTPTGVVISEAVELAKEYSTKDSGRFVNGMLGRIAEEIRSAPANS